MDKNVLTSATWRPRYELLDGLRGLAALTVVLHHLQVFGAGHFAVMVFFVISGYCITAAAESCRQSGIGFGAFMRRRVTRIYPPYLLAIAFFTLTRLAKIALGEHNDLRRSVVVWVQNLTLTQWVSDVFHPVASSTDNKTLFVTAFWSLNYEEQFYFVMAIALLLAIRRRVPLIAPVSILAVVGLIWNWAIPGNWSCGVFIEYWVHFALGSTLFLILCRYTERRARFAFVALIALLGAACAGRILHWNGPDGNDLSAMVELSFLSTVTLALFLRPFSERISRSPLWRPIAGIGAISYSLYLIHQFNLTAVAAAAAYVSPKGTPRGLVIGIMVLMHLALATVFWYFCERPFLKKRAGRGVAKAPPAQIARIA